MLKNIAIYGGAFDPIHKSHIQLIKSVSKMNIIDKVWVLPSGERSDKKILLPMKDRLSILKEIFKNENKVEINEQQIQMSTKYQRMIPTYEFLTLMKQKYPNINFHFVIGADLVKDLSKWSSGEKLKEENSFIIFHRKGYQINHQILPPKCFINNTELQQLSSTAVKAIINDKNINSQQKIQKLESFIPQIVIDSLKANKIL